MKDISTTSLIFPRLLFKILQSFISVKNGILPLSGRVFLYLLLVGSGGRGQILLEDTVIVTASRLSNPLASDIREVQVLNRKDLQMLSIVSVSDLLDCVAGQDARTRGPDGIQSDLSIRGSSGEQVVIMVNGVRLNDPQTGHHNSDIPVTLDDIERIEIMPGHASSLYGPDAWGGVINIITRAPLQKKTRLGIQAGSFKSLGARLSHSFHTGGIGTRLSAEYRSSKGYREDSDYILASGTMETEYEKGSSYVNLRAGFVRKEFGANGFYAPYPSREKTAAYLGTLKYIWNPSSRATLSATLYSRRHDDHFILDRDNPSWYSNAQQTDVSGMETNLTIRFSSSRELVLGSDMVTESLESPGLGNHDRGRYAFFIETIQPLSDWLILHGGVRADNQYSWGTVINPTLGLRLTISPSLVLRFSSGSAFRAPTFTELYYQSPANIGDVNLEPEKAWSSEGGLHFRKGNINAEWTIFRRSEINRIDWIAETAEDPWRVMNIGSLDFTGFSTQVQTGYKIFGMRVQYQYIDCQIPDLPPGISKYALRILRHKAAVTTTAKLPYNVNIGLSAYYMDREGENPYTLINLRCIHKIGNVALTVDLNNLLDSRYQEIQGVVQPGRSLRLSTDWSLL